MRGLSEVVGQEADRAGGLDGRTLARALRRAGDLARRASRGRWKAPSCRSPPRPPSPPRGPRPQRAHPYDVAGAALSAARTALDETTNQLPALARAGVVDAGAAGYVLVLDPSST